MIKVIDSNSAQESVELYVELVNKINSFIEKGVDPRRDFLLKKGKYKAVYMNSFRFNRAFPKSNCDKVNWVIVKRVGD